MGTSPQEQSVENRRTEKRSPAPGYYSVQFTVEGLGTEYQFKLHDISPHGMSILVRQDSEVLNHLHVGDIVEMTYYFEEARHGREHLKTCVRHITENDTGRYKGHCLVGLSQIDNNAAATAAELDTANAPRIL